MQAEVITALIAAIASVIGSALTLFIGLRNIRIEREKLQSDRQRLQSELQERTKQAQVWEAEISRLRAEAHKISLEADEIRRRKLEAERAEIKSSLMLFDRAVFDAPMHSEDPVEMFRALKQTRISLQTSGASLVRDRNVAEHFQSLREILLRVETEVARRFPIVAQLAAEPDDGRPTYERRRQIHDALKGVYYEPVRMMMDIRREIDHHIQGIHARLRELDAFIG